MRGIGGSTLRGGQTVFHGIRMWGQLFQAAMLFAAFMTVAVPAWTLWNRTTGAEWYAAGMVTLAETKIVLGYDPDSGQEVRFADGTRHVLRIRDIAASVPALEAREKIKAELFASAGLGAMAGAGLIGLFLVVFWYRGVQLGRQKRIRGAEMVTAAELRRRLRSPHLRLLARLPGGRRLRPYSIAGIPYPERTETQHTIVSGTTGSGKTVLISDLVSQIRARGERCVIYDKMGSYTRAFFDPGRDVLMNPLDARAPRWSPFLEARNPRDFDMMAAALIPQQKDTVDPFWVTAARQLFSNGAGVFWKKGLTDNKVLVDHLLKTDLTELAEAMEGTVAQSIVDPENPKTALSVRAMLTANLSALEFLPDEGQAVLDPRVDIRRGARRVPVPDLARRPACEPARPDLDLAGDRGQRHADARPGRRPAHLGDPRRAADAPPGAVIAARPRRIAPVRRLLRARRPGRRGASATSTAATAPRPSRASAAPVSCSPRRTGTPRNGPPTASGRSEVEEVTEGYTYGANTIRDGVSAHAAARTPRAGAAVRDHAARQSRGLSQVPRPLPGRLDPAQIRRPPGCGRAVRAARGTTGSGPMAMRTGRRLPSGHDSAGTAGTDVSMRSRSRTDPDEAGRWRAIPIPHDMPPEPASLAGRAGSCAPAGERPAIRDRTPPRTKRRTQMAPESKAKAPDADGATPAPHDGAAVDGSEPANPPRSADADAGGDRGSEWL